MVYVVYVLYSSTFRQTYVGQTQNLDARLSRHNAGCVPSTQRYRPWIVIHVEEFESRGDAMRRERWLKSGVGREFVAGLLKRDGQNGWLHPPQADARKGLGVRIPRSPQMVYVVYVLYSSTFRQTYVGQTQNLDARLSRHNAGCVPSTQRYRPWIVIHVEEFESRGDAMRRERWLKSGVGREFVAGLLKRDGQNG